MSETLSAYSSVTKLFSDTILNATDLNTAKSDTIAAAVAAVGSSGGSGALPVASTVTLGGVKIDGATILISSGAMGGVISVGAVPWTSITGAPALGPLAALSVPAPGIVYSTGTALSPLTIGANLTLTGSTLAATGGFGVTVPTASLLGGNGTALTAVTVGAGLALTSGTLSLSLAAGTTAGTYAAGNDPRIVGAAQTTSLGPLATAALPAAGFVISTGTGLISSPAPAAGIVYSNGTTLAPLTLGTNLSLTGTTLNAASGGGASFPGGAGLASATGTAVTVSTGLSLSGGALSAAAATASAPGAVQLAAGQTSATLAAVATTGAYGSLTGAPTLGSASALAASAVAQTANNLSDLASASAARTNLGLGTAATAASTAFDAAGAAAAETTRAQTAEAGLAAKTGLTFTSGASVVMAATQAMLIVRKATGSATAVTLPASPAQWQRYTVKDGKGDAGTNPITITPSAGTGTIDGQASQTINNPYGSYDMTYDGTNWSIN